MDLRRWHKIALGTLVTIFVLAMIVGQVTVVGINEYYSSGWHSHSASEARAQRSLVSQPIVATRTVTWGGQPFVVREAWIEHRTHLVYRFYLFRRVVNEDRFRLLVRMAPQPSDRVSTTSTLSGTERLAYDDSLTFNSSYDGEVWVRDVEPPFPDTLRLRVLRR